MFQSRLMRSAAALAIVLVAMIALPAITYDGGLAGFIRDYRDRDSLREQTERAARSNGAIDIELVSVQERILLKDRWLADLANGRTSLRQTIRSYIELNRNHEPARRAIQETYPGDSEEEKVGRAIVKDISVYIALVPSPSGTLLRVQNEFHALFGNTVAAE